MLGLQCVSVSAYSCNLSIQSAFFIPVALCNLLVMSFLQLSDPVSLMFGRGHPPMWSSHFVLTPKGKSVTQAHLSILNNNTPSPQKLNKNRTETIRQDRDLCRPTYMWKQSTTVSRQEGLGFDSRLGHWWHWGDIILGGISWAILCGVCLFSPCSHGLPP